MLEAYSLNVAVAANDPIPFNNTALLKGCTAVLPSPSTINLNKCGIYMVEVDASTDTSTTIQLYKDGVAQAQAQSTGLTPSFTTLVQVDHNNSNCCCASPTAIQVKSSEAVTFTDANITITKIC